MHETHTQYWQDEIICKILLENIEYVLQHGRSRRSWEDNIEIRLTGTWREVRRLNLLGSGLSLL
jgi:hypothetical protein